MEEEEDGAGEVEVFEDEVGDAVVEAGDAVPGAGVGGRGVPLGEEFVGRVGGGFERQLVRLPKVLTSFWHRCWGPESSI